MNKHGSYMFKNIIEKIKCEYLLNAINTHLLIYPFCVDVPLKLLK